MSSLGSGGPSGGCSPTAGSFGGAGCGGLGFSSGFASTFAFAVGLGGSGDLFGAPLDRGAGVLGLRAPGRIDADRRAGFNRENGRLVDRKPAPAQILGTRLQMVIGRNRLRERRCAQRDQPHRGKRRYPLPQRPRPLGPRPKPFESRHSIPPVTVLVSRYEAQFTPILGPGRPWMGLESGRIRSQM